MTTISGQMSGQSRNRLPGVREASRGAALSAAAASKEANAQAVQANELRLETAMRMGISARNQPDDSLRCDRSAKWVGFASKSFLCASMQK
jgi:hypothetical protein